MQTAPYMRLYFITNQPSLATMAWQSGVDRIFVDLEYIGKEARQPGFQYVISHHSIADLQAIHYACPQATLLARINPLNEGTEAEINQCIDAGASVIMLPMFRQLADLEAVADIIQGRTTFCPLIETWEAVDAIDSFVNFDKADEFHFGLTDLSLASAQPFVFQPWALGRLEGAFKALRASGKPFGVGGVARVGEGLLPGEVVMGEHARVGSTAAMLSQTFHHRLQTVEAIAEKMDFAQELVKLRSAFEQFCHGTHVALQQNHELFVRDCNAINQQMQGIVI